MIRIVKLLALALTLTALVAGVQARPDDKPKDDKNKEVTLKGDVCCAKCELGMGDKCATVIRVKESGKDVIYYFDADAHKKHHAPVCKAVKEGTVMGKISEKDGKKIVTVTKLEFKK